MRFEDLPYRPCVGLMVLNRDGLAFIGRRIGGPEHVDLTHAWQMPQGGIDPGEEPWLAAVRELREETNIRSVERIAIWAKAAESHGLLLVPISAVAARGKSS
jgi:putative (di)nucleoside polyphosphate hydrolase